MLHFDSEVTLYADGTFVPRLTAAIFQRIVKSPEKFEVQRFRVTGARFDVFKKYAALLSRSKIVGTKDFPDLLPLVRPLVRLAKELPDYVIKTRQMFPLP